GRSAGRLRAYPPPCASPVASRSAACVSGSRGRRPRRRGRGQPEGAMGGGGRFPACALGLEPGALMLRRIAGAAESDAAGPAPANRARTGRRPCTDPAATTRRYPVADFHGLRTMSPRLLLAAALLFLPATQAQVPTDAGTAQMAQADAHQAYMQRLASALARDGGARDLALAALLRDASVDRRQAPDDPTAAPVPRDAQAEAWLRAAAAKAGDDLIANRLLVLAAGPEDGALRME